jgi:hypothetical protein
MRDVAIRTLIIWLNIMMLIEFINDEDAQA